MALIAFFASVRLKRKQEDGEYRKLAERAYVPITVDTWSNPRFKEVPTAILQVLLTIIPITLFVLTQLPEQLRPVIRSYLLIFLMIWVVYRVRQKFRS